MPPGTGESQVDLGFLHLHGMLPVHAWDLRAGWKIPRSTWESARRPRAQGPVAPRARFSDQSRSRRAITRSQASTKRWVAAPGVTSVR